MNLLWTEQGGKLTVDERRTVLAAVKWADILIERGVAEADTIRIESLTREGKSRIRSLKAARWEVVGSADWEDVEHDPEPSSGAGAVLEIKAPGGEEWVKLRRYADSAEAEAEIEKYEKFLHDRVRLRTEATASA